MTPTTIRAACVRLAERKDALGDNVPASGRAPHEIVRLYMVGLDVDAAELERVSLKVAMATLRSAAEEGIDGLTMTQGTWADGFLVGVMYQQAKDGKP